MSVYKEPSEEIDLVLEKRKMIFTKETLGQSSRPSEIKRIYCWML